MGHLLRRSETMVNLLFLETEMLTELLKLVQPNKVHVF